MRAPLPPSTNSPARQPAARRPAWWLAISLAGLLGLGLLFVQARAMAVDPELDITAVVAPGSQVALAGSGFAPSTHVDLAWKGLPAEIADVRADATGRFETLVAVPDDAAAGTYTITATEHLEHPAPAAALRVVTITLRVVAQSGTVASDDTRDEMGVLPSSSPEMRVEAVPPAPTHHEGSADDSANGAQHDVVAGTPQPVAAPTPAPGAHDPAVPHPSPTPSPSAEHHGGNVNPVSCSGYAEPRTFLEIHTWWEGPPLPKGEVAHLHVGSCVPLGQPLSGVIPFDVRIVMHNNPGHLFRYETGLFTDGQGEGGPTIVPLDERCASTCEYWVKTQVDTRTANDGWQELRFKARVEFSNGERQLTSSGWPIETRNGNESGGSRPDLGTISGRGWYTDRGYQNAGFESTSDVLPGKVVRGVWEPQIRLNPGSGGQPSTFTAAYIDADFHAHDEDSSGGGIVLGQWSEEFRGTVRIDTTKLHNGAHMLILRSDAVHDGTRLSGLQYVQFIVNN